MTSRVSTTIRTIAFGLLGLVAFTPAHGYEVIASANVLTGLVGHPTHPRVLGEHNLTVNGIQSSDRPVLIDYLEGSLFRHSFEVDDVEKNNTEECSTSSSTCYLAGLTIFQVTTEECQDNLAGEYHATIWGTVQFENGTGGQYEVQDSDVSDDELVNPWDCFSY
jgi:hypothetical protein